MIWQETPVQQTDSGGYEPQLRYSSGVKVDNGHGIWELYLQNIGIQAEKFAASAKGK